MEEDNDTVSGSYPVLLMRNHGVPGVKSHVLEVAQSVEKLDFETKSVSEVPSFPLHCAALPSPFLTTCGQCSCPVLIHFAFREDFSISIKTHRK